MTVQTTTAINSVNGISGKTTHWCTLLAIEHDRGHVHGMQTRDDQMFRG